jgi:predicted nucleotidyltransferase
METSAMSSQAVEFLAPVVGALEQALGNDLIALVLFGSRARDDARPDSDWDLLLIADGLPLNTLQRHFFLKQLLPPELAGQLSLVTQTPAELDSYLTSLFLDIALDGIVLYDTDNFITTRLDQARQIIRQKKLQRKQANGEFSWQWDTPQGFNWSIEWGKA